MARGRVSELYTDHCISISEFRRNPTRFMSNADNGVLLVINQNEPAFYCIQPDLFNSMMELLETIYWGSWHKVVG